MTTTHYTQTSHHFTSHYITRLPGWGLSTCRAEEQVLCSPSCWTHSSLSCQILAVQALFFRQCCAETTA